MKRDKLLLQLEKARGRLKEALDLPKESPLAIDGTIQRFEFCFELAWKTIKAFLHDDGIVCNSPRESIKEAFKFKWITDEEKWLELLDARNLTTHVYDEETSLKVYDVIVKNCAVFGLLVEALKKVATKVK